MELLQRAKYLMSLATNSPDFPQGSAPASFVSAATGGPIQQSTAQTQQQRPASPVQSKPMTCQESLTHHLSSSPADLTRAFALLPSLEAEFRAAAADSKPASVGGCFDISSSPSWCSHSLCTRCRSLNVLRMAGDSSLSQCLFEPAISVTECTSLRQRTGVVPTLPFELIETIVSMFISQTIITLTSGPGETLIQTLLPPTTPGTQGSAKPHHAAILSLLHSSSYLRTCISKQLSFELPLDKRQLLNEERWMVNRLASPPTASAQFDKHAEQALKWYFLSRESYVLKILMRASEGPINRHLSLNGVPVHNIKVSIDWPASSLGSVGAVKAVQAERGADKAGPPLSWNDLKGLLLEVFHAAVPSPEQSQYVRVLACMRGTNPAEVRLTLEFPDVTHGHHAPTRLCWNAYHTRPRENVRVQSPTQRVDAMLQRLRSARVSE